MVKTDNKVALRQLELANAALLSTTALRSYPGKSLAKDGKFHPRVMTLVRVIAACHHILWLIHTPCRVVTTLSPSRFFVVLLASTAPLGTHPSLHGYRIRLNADALVQRHPL